MRDDLFYAQYILDCVVRIERYCAGGMETFLADELIQDGVLRNLHVLAESSQRISQETKNRSAHRLERPFRFSQRARA